MATGVQGSLTPKELSPVRKMDKTLQMLPTLYCLAGEQEWLAQVGTSKLQESKVKLPHMAGNLLGSRMARGAEHLVWDTSVSGTHQQGLKTVQDAQMVLFHMREKTCESVFVHVHGGVKETEIPREGQGQ